MISSLQRDRHSWKLLKSVKVFVRRKIALQGSNNNMNERYMLDASSMLVLPGFVATYTTNYQYYQKNLSFSFILSLTD